MRVTAVSADLKGIILKVTKCLSKWRTYVLRILFMLFPLFSVTLSSAGSDQVQIGVASASDTSEFVDYKYNTIGADNAVSMDCAQEE